MLPTKHLEETRGKDTAEAIKRSKPAVTRIDDKEEAKNQPASKRQRLQSGELDKKPVIDDVPKDMSKFFIAPQRCTQTALTFKVLA